MADALTPGQRERVIQYWQRLYDRAAGDIARATVAIFGYHNKRVDQNGSGVLLRVGDKHFLLSAAHVIDFAAIHNIPYMLSPPEGGQDPVPLHEVRSCTSPVPHGKDPKALDMRDRDPFDVGFVELNAEVVGRLLPGRRFVTLGELDVDARLRRGCYLIYGFPHRLSVTDEVNRRTYSQPFRHVTEITNDLQDAFDPHLHIRLKYPEMAITSGRAEVAVPSPKGMSGCGIWRLAALKPEEQWSKDDVKLVAIDHTWNRERRYVHGTRVPYLLSMIYRHYPSLRPVMDLHLGLATQGW